MCHLTKITKSIDLGLQKPWELRKLTNCNSSLVIYLITYPCDKRYVSMMMRKVKVRLMEHRSNVRCKKTTTRMLHHYVELQHTTEDLNWVILEKLDPYIKNPEKTLYKHEQRWIHRLHSNIVGLNDDIQWSHFYS